MEFPRYRGVAASKVVPAPTEALNTGKSSPKLAQIATTAALSLVFIIGVSCFHLMQWCAAPVYFWRKDLYYWWQATVKNLFALLIISLTTYWSPTKVEITWDASVANQIFKKSDGSVILNFPHRLVLISNHRLYTDWVFLWWSAYCSDAAGYLYILLKQSLKWTPLLGWGMQFFSFIFLARNWANDEPRLKYRLDKLQAIPQTPAAKKTQDQSSMWLMLFPEGTTLCQEARDASARWAAKTNIEDLKHHILPKSKGLRFVLEGLRKSVDYVYDCTLSYADVPPNWYGQDYFTLKRIYLGGEFPSKIHMHWRRFKISDIPLEDAPGFDKWLVQRYREKDTLIEYCNLNGTFPEHDGKVVADARLRSYADMIPLVLSLLLFPLYWKVVFPGLWFLVKCVWWTGDW